MKLTFLVNEDRIRKKAKVSPPLARRLENSRIRGDVLRGAGEYRDLCQEEWTKTYEDSHRLMKELTGLSERYMGREFTVYVFHPGMHTDCNSEQKGDTYEIECPRHGERRKYQNTVGIWHRIMHSFLPQNEVSHAIIELAVDNELQVRLRGGYIDRNLGDPERYELRKYLWEPWLDHQKLERKSILKFYTEMKRLKGSK